MTNSITIQEAANELDITIEQLIPLLDGHYKNPAKVKAISSTKWDLIKANYKALNTAEEDNDSFLSQPIEQPQIQEEPEMTHTHDNYRQQANIQRKQDMQDAWVTTAQQATEFAESLEEGFWLMTAAARSSSKVQSSERVKRARDLAIGIGDGGLQASAHIQSVEAYLTDKGFFQTFLTGLEEPRQLTN